MNPYDSTDSADSTAVTMRGIVFNLGLYESSDTKSPLTTGLASFLLGDPSRDTMFASQDALSKDWASPEEDIAWAAL
jgi:hypothetical protein